VLLHIESAKARAEIRHVYLHDARSLRPDLADP
jgi:chorismate mutase